MSSIGSALSPVTTAIAVAVDAVPAALCGEVWRTASDELDRVPATFG